MRDAPDPDRKAEMAELLADIEREARYVGGASQAAADPKVLAALRAVPRHAFVPNELSEQAYGNYPLSIGHGQTISQPFIVALMSGLLNLPKDATVLEIGTGSGYQGAVLAHLARRVYSIEIIPHLARLAEQHFAALGIANVEVRCGDGYQGWPEHAPYDGIIVTAAAPHIPEPLIEQLKPGARLVIPVGLRYMPQNLLVVKKAADGSVSGDNVLPVAFVPLTGNLVASHNGP
ncbi:MAG: protein-L-isoaspartate(D-aspartate) O-methyltransferase [Sulfuricella sp.]|nr:protein-L-isoaspartate(D-aspartate) O-methyltransferase [Sulfuricella sp.]